MYGLNKKVYARATTRWSRLPKRTYKPSARASTSGYRKAAVSKARKATPSGAGGAGAADQVLQSLINRHIAVASEGPKLRDQPPPSILKPVEIKESKDEEKVEFGEEGTDSSNIDSIKAVLASSHLFTPGKIWKFRIATTLGLSTTALTGINAVVQASTLSGLSGFIALQALFNEFFVVGMTLKFMPLAMFQYPGSAPVATQNPNQPLGICQLQGTEPAYATCFTMANNRSFKWASTAIPWTYTWRNVNRYKFSESPLSSTAPTYAAWCPMSAAANYLGQVQFITPGLQGEISQPIGTIAFFADIVVRTRL